METYRKFTAFLNGEGRDAAKNVRIGMAVFSAAAFLLACAGSIILWYMASVVNDPRYLEQGLPLGGLDWRFLTDPAYLGGSVFLAWLMTLTIFVAARFFITFVSSGKKGSGIWVKKYLMTETDKKFRFSATHLVARLYFRACLAKWRRSAGENLSAKAVWEACFAERGAFFDAALTSGTDALSLFRAHLNDFGNRGNRFATRTCALTIGWMFIVGLFGGIGAILTYCLVVAAYPLGADVLAASSLSTVGAVMALMFACVTFVWMYVVKVFGCLERNALWNWFSVDGTIVSDKPDNAQMIGMMYMSRGFGRGVGLSLAWTWVKYRKAAGMRKIPIFAALHELIGAVAGTQAPLVERTKVNDAAF